MIRAYLGLGSNLGDRAASLRRACNDIETHELIDIYASSPIYESEPVGLTDNGTTFLNQVIAVDTALPPGDLLMYTSEIEIAHGRRSKGDHRSRSIDIDLLIYGSARIERNDLIVPHPRLTERPFVLVPLLDIAPELRDPVTDQSYRELITSAMVERVIRYSSEHGDD